MIFPLEIIGKIFFETLPLIENIKTFFYIRTFLYEFKLDCCAKSLLKKHYWFHLKDVCIYVKPFEGFIPLNQLLDSNIKLIKLINSEQTMLEINLKNRHIEKQRTQMNFINDNYSENMYLVTSKLSYEEKGLTIQEKYKIWHIQSQINSMLKESSNYHNLNILFESLYCKDISDLKRDITGAIEGKFLNTLGNLDEIEIPIHHPLRKINSFLRCDLLPKNNIISTKVYCDNYYLLPIYTQNRFNLYWKTIFLKKIYGNKLIPREQRFFITYYFLEGHNYNITREFFLKKFLLLCGDLKINLLKKTELETMFLQTKPYILKARRLRFKLFFLIHYILNNCKKNKKNKKNNNKTLIIKNISNNNQQNENKDDQVNEYNNKKQNKKNKNNTNNNKNEIKNEGNQNVQNEMNPNENKLYITNFNNIKTKTTNESFINKKLETKNRNEIQNVNKIKNNVDNPHMGEFSDKKLRQMTQENYLTSENFIFTPLINTFFKKVFIVHPQCKQIIENLKLIEKKSVQIVEEETYNFSNTIVFKTLVNHPVIRHNIPTTQERLFILCEEYIKENSKNLNINKIKLLQKNKKVDTTKLMEEIEIELDSKIQEFLLFKYQDIFLTDDLIAYEKALLRDIAMQQYKLETLYTLESDKIKSLHSLPDFKFNPDSFSEYFARKNLDDPNFSIEQKRSFLNGIKKYLEELIRNKKPLNSQSIFLFEFLKEYKHIFW